MGQENLGIRRHGSDHQLLQGLWYFRWDGGTEDGLVVAADTTAEISAETTMFNAGKQYCM